MTTTIWIPDYAYGWGSGTAEMNITEKLKKGRFSLESLFDADDFPD